MSDLIDTTEMYLRTIFELEEEGVRPMRARIAEKLGQSGPTVSQTVARMHRDQLVDLDADDRHVVLTAEGMRRATRVMRKHRIAECLLVEVIGMPWEEVHAEACRWEHVMSDSVERRLLELLDHPTVSPFGNPIPGLDELAGPERAGRAPAGQQGEDSGAARPAADIGVAAQPLATLLSAGASAVFVVVRIAETLQAHDGVLADLHRAGVTPGAQVAVERHGETFQIGPSGSAVLLSKGLAAGIFVRGTVT